MSLFEVDPYDRFMPLEEMVFTYVGHTTDDGLAALRRFKEWLSEGVDPIEAIRDVLELGYATRGPMAYAQDRLQERPSS